MKFLSLFSGIGGFETTLVGDTPLITPSGVIVRMLTKTPWECVGFSEIDPYAIRIYQSHYPSHKPLGDITKITEDEILALGQIDLIVGGFPCKNLSSMARINGDSRGLGGTQSKLFTDYLRILKICKKNNPNIRFCMENNASMSKKWKEQITEILSTEIGEICVSELDNALFGVQQRKRIIWTNFPIPLSSYDSRLANQHSYDSRLANQHSYDSRLANQHSYDSRLANQTWEHVLEPIENVKSKFLSEKMIKCLNKTYPRIGDSKKPAKIVVEKEKGCFIFTDCKEGNEGKKSRWEIQPHSDTFFPKSRPIITCGGANNILFDRRISSTGEGVFDEGVFIPRYFSILETERLFGFPDGYTAGVSETRRYNALGNSIPVFLVNHVLQFLPSN